MATKVAELVVSVPVSSYRLVDGSDLFADFLKVLL